MNQKPSQLRLLLSWSHAVASRMGCLAALVPNAMSAIGVVPYDYLRRHCLSHSPRAKGARAGLKKDRAGRNSMRPAPSSSTINALQLPFGNGDRALGVVASAAVVGEHVDHQEVGDRGRRLLAGRADAGSRQRALAGLAEHLVLRIGGPDG